MKSTSISWTGLPKVPCSLTLDTSRNGDNGDITYHLAGKKTPVFVYRHYLTFIISLFVKP